MRNMKTVPVNVAAFIPDHVVLLAECPAVSYAVIDVNDSMATCNYDCCAAGNDDVNVADNTSRRCVKSIYE